MRSTRRLPYVAALAAAALLLIGAPLSQAATSTATSSTATAKKAAVKKLAFTPYRINGQPIHALPLTDIRQFSSLSIPDLERIKSDGFNMVTIYVYRFVATKTSDTQASGVLTEPDASITATVKAAHLVGLQVQLIPTIWIGTGVTGYDWRGDAQPDNVADFFNSYRQMTNHYAELAQKDGIELYGVGSEMVSLEQYTTEWQQTVGEVRQHYTGPVTYFTVWATVNHIAWWSSIDYPGVSTYMSLASAPIPTYQDIANGWNQVNLPILKKKDQAVGRPMIIDEVGYSSAMGAATHPEIPGSGVPEMGEQQDLYRAILDIVLKQPYLDGVSFYNWSAYNQGATNTAYSPKGKSAECEIVEHWASPTSLQATECAKLGMVLA